jgi:transcriptional regulator with XRE-family HTH domain
MEKLVFPLSQKEAERAGIKEKDRYTINLKAFFPTQMRKLRSELKITQETLANEIGVTKSTISLYETGDNVPDIKTLAKIADFYGVSADWLLGRTPDPTTDIDVKAICEKTGLTGDAIEILVLYNEQAKTTKTKVNIPIEKLKIISFLLCNVKNDDFLDLLTQYFIFNFIPSRNYSYKTKTRMGKAFPNHFHVEDTATGQELTLDPKSLIDIYQVQIGNMLPTLREKYRDIHGSVPDGDNETQEE